MSRRHHRNEDMPKPSARQSLAAVRINDRKRGFRKHFDQYCHDASLHGLRYIGDRTLTWFERYQIRRFFKKRIYVISPVIIRP